MRDCLAVLSVALTLAALQCMAAAPQADDAARQLHSRYEKEIQPLLSEYCFQCHGNGKKKGGITLDNALPLDAREWDATPWAEALTQMRDGNMPPEEAAELPAAGQREQLMTWLQQAVD